LKILAQLLGLVLPVGFIVNIVRIAVGAVRIAGFLFLSAGRFPHRNAVV
jgi:hypothetical protein